MLPSKKVVLVTLAGFAAFYAVFAISVRGVAQGESDQLKILLFAAIVTTWLFVCLAIGGKFNRRSVGFRVTILVIAFFGTMLGMSQMKRWLYHDLVWRELWDMNSVLFILPLAQGMFSRPKEEKLEPNQSLQPTAPRGRG
jgi:hypothetical protein